MKYSVNKVFILSLILLGLGSASLIAENIFYQYIDDNGVLHESLFMPLGSLSMIVGVLVLLFYIIQKVRYLLSHK